MTRVLLTEMKLSQSWKPYVIEKSSQVLLEAALALSVMPPHGSELPLNVSDEERCIVLALQNAHSIVTSKHSRAHFVQKHVHEQPSNHTVKVGYHHSHSKPLF